MKHINAQFCQGVRTPAAALRRRVARVAAFAMTALALVGGVALAPQVTYAEDVNLSAPDHHKAVKDNGDGTYTVTLNVTGNSQETPTTTHKPIDIVVVMDTSGSMAWDMEGDRYHPNEPSRLKVAQDAVNNLAKSLLTSENTELGNERQIQMAIVSFADSATQQQGFTSNSGLISTAVNKLQADGGTNWEAGLKRANEINSGRTDAEKYIVFLSDGDPTFRESHYLNQEKVYDARNGDELHYVGNNWWGHYENDKGEEVPDEYVERGDGRGTGSSDPFGLNFSSAVEEANRRGAATLYSVGLSTDPEKMQDFASQTKGKYFLATNQEELNKAFDSIIESITKTAFTDVTIYDRLSEQRWVTFADITADGTPVFKYAKTDAKGNAVPWGENSPVPASYNSDTGVISWPVVDKDTVLEKDVTYTVSFMVKATQKAYDNAASDSPTKDAQSAEAETDDPNRDNANSYFTNDNAEAKVIYRTKETVSGGSGVNSDEKTAYYNKPTITLPVSTITVNKVWAGSKTNPDSVTIQLKQKQGNTDIVYGSVVLNDGNNWTHTFNVPAGPEGHTYTVEETAVDNYDTTYEYSVQTNGSAVVDDSALKLVGLTEQKASVTVTNTLAVADLMITKVVDGSAANTSQHFKFNLEAGTLNGDYDVEYIGDDSHAEKVTFVDGKAMIELKHNETVTIKNLPKTTVVKISESGLNKTVTVATRVGNAGWTTLNKVADDDTKTQQLQVTVGEDTNVTFRNTTNLVPVLGVFTNSAPMIGLLAVALIGGSILAATEGKRAFGKHGGHGWKE